MNDKLKPCPMCGSPARIESTGTTECYGHAWQTLYVECTDVNGEHCGMDISITMDFWNCGNSEEVITAAWNSLERK